MVIEIVRQEDRYSARVTPPHSKFGDWVTEKPVTQEELRHKMYELGVHEVDMWDFVRGADRRWEEKRKQDSELV